MLLREFTGGDLPHTCKLIFRDDPSGFGHRVMDGDRVAEQILTKKADFETAVAEKLAEGFAETERSLTRRMFATSDRFWIVMLDGDTLLTHFGGIRVNWQESSGQNKAKEFRDRDRAVAAYVRAIEGKLAEGYRKNHVRKVPLPIPTAAKKPGKRGAR